MILQDHAFSLPTKPKDRLILGNQFGSGLALTLAEVVHRHEGLVVVVVADSNLSSQLERELHFFLQSTSKKPKPIVLFPDWETLPYDTFSPHQDIISERLKTLYRLEDLKEGVLVVPIATLMQRLCPKEYLLQNTVWVQKGETLDLEIVRKRLIQSGYRLSPQVMERGEFFIRGAILDLFPMGSKMPYRLDLLDNEIDSIRTFEVETQRSQDKIDRIQLLPAREFPFTSEAISKFRTQFRDTFEGDPTQCSLYLDVSDGNASPGLEYYLPLFFEELSHLFDYLPKNSLMVTVEDVGSAAENFWEYYKARYEQYRHDRLRPILEPKKLCLDASEVFAKMNQFPKVKLTKETKKIKDREAGDNGSRDNGDGIINLKQKPLPALGIEARLEKPYANLSNFLENFNGRVLFCAESAGRREVLSELLHNINCKPVVAEHWVNFLQSEEPLMIAIAPLDEGVSIEGNIALITESELLGKRVMQRRLRKSKHQTFDKEVQNLAELTLGSPVVHIEHGVGRYLGLTSLTLSGHQGEFVTLEYAEGDRLYVPVQSLQLISRYSGVDIEHAPLHRLGSDQWQRAKQRAMEQIRDSAAELLEIYAMRDAKQGFAFPKPDEHYETFAAHFPFEETPDQQRAIEEVLKDLMSPKPMDRVVCGDVGFGKTEVALRASFLAVQAGKQVAVLVPTTLLAEQHHQTFLDRFSGFPIRIEVISRFRSKKEQDTICETLQEGKIDILIGTHKILQDTIKFKSLGLLIIDEEHRFGVRQKEAFKALRAEVDILTLTATPIPRTLNMAMSGLRDLSIIATPPAKRLSIKTFVRERHSSLIAEAISRELHRGGQVYFLHNMVESIEREADQLQTLVPQARIAVAHGQMPERDLERVMSDFYHRRHNVLICTTIIETGIDIPTANTIIIDRADKFGLAQLHQLRGRVGRSHHQAYAFCLIPPKAKISRDAVKRLEALEALEDLGAGFTLATQDLEIRGAGELLGESQSGNIQSIGFTLYMELLDQAVKTLREGKTIALEPSFKRGVEIDLQIPALIPESYIPDVHTRLVLYKRIASSRNSEALEDLISEMIDRFGVLPQQTKNLFKITELKLQSEPLGICKIEAGPKGGRLEFGLKPNVDPSKIIRLIQQSPTIYSLEGGEKLRFRMDLSNGATRVQEVVKVVSGLN